MSNVRVLHTNTVDLLNPEIQGLIGKGYIPYGVPFIMGTELCQLMFTNEKLKLNIIPGLSYIIRLTTAVPLDDHKKGITFKFNGETYSVYVRWPMAHLQTHLQTILCLKGAFPI